MPQNQSSRPFRNLTDRQLAERKGRSVFGMNAYEVINPANQHPLVVEARDAAYNAIKKDDLGRQLWDNTADVFTGLTKPLTRSMLAESTERSKAELEEFYRKRERENPNRYGTTALGGFDRAPARQTPPPQQLIKNQYDQWLLDHLRSSKR
jgi:hypothetical protein